MEFLFLLSLALSQVTPVEAPVGFDGLTNGFTTQAEFEADRSVFAAREVTGVAFNHNSCAACHFSPLDGGAAPGIAELRVGRLANGVFSGGRIVHLASTDPNKQEKIDAAENVRSRRTALSIFGDGFVECVSNSTLQANVQANIVGGVRGELTVVPIAEAPPGSFRFGRFGWKCQQSSLQSFTKDASDNEIGEDNPIDSEDILAETRFQRSLKAPPRDEVLANTPAALAGSALFDQIGCVRCHTRTFTTAKPGTSINGGKFVVPAALGSKIIHPFSDFALWNIGTGDGIQHDGAPATTRNKMRTAPLWGLRTRALFFHDGRAITLNQALLSHGGVAAGVTAAYRGLSAVQQGQVLAFLSSL
jgi:CxxC motif-containing protein (DUF1111 family)